MFGCASDGTKKSSTTNMKITEEGDQIASKPGTFVEKKLL